MAEKKKADKKTLQRWKLYAISGNKIERKNKTCPKCGSDSFLAKHKDRETCGKCGYTQFVKQ